MTDKCPKCGADYAESYRQEGDVLIECDEGTIDRFDCGTVEYVNDNEVAQSDQCRIRVLESRLAESERGRKVAEEALALVAAEAEVCKDA